MDFLLWQIVITATPGFNSVDIRSILPQHNVIIVMKYNIRKRKRGAEQQAMHLMRESVVKLPCSVLEQDEMWHDESD